MSINVDGYGLGDVTTQPVNIRPLLGSYELVFPICVSLNVKKEIDRRALIFGARVFVKASAGPKQEIGFARPDGEVLLEPKSEFIEKAYPVFSLPLQIKQLAAIEDQRLSGNLDFESAAIGKSYDNRGPHHMEATWNFHVPRSTWIEKLRSARAFDILLLEVSVPVGVNNSKWKTIKTNIENAYQQFYEGHYVSSVGTCRKVLDELGHKLTKKKDWARPIMEQLKGKQSEMRRDDREAAIFAMVRHYTNQAHHVEGDGGVSTYSRSDAKFVLTLTTAMAARLATG